MLGMTDGERVQADLESAVRDHEERRGLEQRLRSAEDQLAACEQRVRERNAALSSEAKDVERLESFSPTRIWASLRGSRDADLDKETAEREAARYAAAEAQARRDAAQRDRDGFAAQIGALGDVAARYGAALAAKDAWLRDTGSPQAAELAQIATERGELVARQRETAEALDAGVAARNLLGQADQLLGAARGWSTMDTFFDGGMLTDMAKYDRIDKATAVLHQADIALAAFSRELADIGVQGVRGVEVTGMTRTFDVFFDNIFSDMAVRSRIMEAADRTRQALSAVAGLLPELDAKRQQIGGQLAELDRRRERLLVG